jgi:hypothetical protein
MMRAGRHCCRVLPRPGTAWFFCLAALVASTALPLRPEIIDRVAVAVGNRVITSSEIDRQIRAVAFLNGQVPDLSPAGRRNAAQRMIEQKLIQRELETGRYTSPAPEDAPPIAAQLQRERFGGSEAAFNSALAAAGLSPDDLQVEVFWQQTLLAFIESRFRPLVQVSDDEIRQYFENIVKPAAQAANPGQPVDLEDYREKIDETLAGPRVDEEVSRWLKEMRSRVQVTFNDEAFQ